MSSPGVGPETLKSTHCSADVETFKLTLILLVSITDLQEWTGHIPGDPAEGARDDRSLFLDDRQRLQGVPNDVAEYRGL